MHVEQRTYVWSFWATVKQMSVVNAGKFLNSAEGLGSVSLDLHVTLSFAANLGIFSPFHISLQFMHLCTSLKVSLS